MRPGATSNYQESGHMRPQEWVEGGDAPLAADRAISAYRLAGPSGLRWPDSNRPREVLSERA